MMKKHFRIKVTLTIIAGIFLLFFFLHCKKYNEEAPFFDGLFLEYNSHGKPRFIYNISAFGDKKFKILETRKSEALGDKTNELFVNANGKVYKSSKKRYEDKFTPIWIPVNEMEIGEKFDGRNTVTRKDQWEIWNVLVITDTPTGAESYFHLDTGFWVGSFAKTPAGIGKFVLAKTNADIPTVEK